MERFCDCVPFEGRLLVDSLNLDKSLGFSDFNLYRSDKVGSFARPLATITP